jgi:hypothetical protein
MSSPAPRTVAAPDVTDKLLRDRPVWGPFIGGALVDDSGRGHHPSVGGLDGDSTRRSRDCRRGHRRPCSRGRPYLATTPVSGDSRPGFRPDDTVGLSCLIPEMSTCLNPT